MLKGYGIESANSLTTTLPKDADLLPAHEHEALLNTAEHKKYRSLTESWLYISACTRSDISFPVSVLARQVYASTMHHMNILKRVLDYVTGTVHYGLKYPCSVNLSPQSLEVHADSDWGECRETRNFNSGWAIGINNSPVAWKSRNQ